MSQDTGNITLGSGRLYINDVEVGYLKGDVEFKYTREKLPFKPSGSLGPVISYVIGEEAILSAAIAEFKIANLRLAMGVSTALSSFSGTPSYNPASFDSNTNLHDVLTFGGSLTIVSNLAIRFEHERPGSEGTVVIVLYTAESLSDLALAFHDEDFNMTNVSFRGLANTARPVGDQIGMVIVEEQS